jgi:hypothetical protein
VRYASGEQRTILKSSKWPLALSASARLRYRLSCSGWSGASILSSIKMTNFSLEDDSQRPQPHPTPRNHCALKHEREEHWPQRIRADLSWRGTKRQMSWRHGTPLPATCPCHAQTGEVAEEISRIVLRAIQACPILIPRPEALPCPPTTIQRRIRPHDVMGTLRNHLYSRFRVPRRPHLVIYALDFNGANAPFASMIEVA